MRSVLREMLVLRGEKRNLSREDASTLCSLAADLRVRRPSMASKGVHSVVWRKKSVLAFV
jgi:acetamidase/formamidase